MITEFLVAKFLVAKSLDAKLLVAKLLFGLFLVAKFLVARRRKAKSGRNPPFFSRHGWLIHSQPRGLSTFVSESDRAGDFGG